MFEEFQDIERTLSVRRSLYNIIFDPEIDPKRDRMIKELLSKMSRIFDGRGFHFATYTGGRKGRGSILSADFRTADLAIQGKMNYRNCDLFNGIIDIGIRVCDEIKQFIDNRSWNIGSFKQQYDELRKLLKMEDVLTDNR